MAKKAAEIKAVDDLEDEKSSEVEATEKEVDPQDLEAAPNSRWMSILDDALEGYEPAPSYFFDGFGPKNLVEITPPDSAERALAIINLCDLKGDVEMKDVKPYLEALLGDSFDLIWKFKLSRLPVGVSIAFARELQEHFFGDGTIQSLKDNGADKLPGGSQGS